MIWMRRSQRCVLALLLGLAFPASAWPEISPQVYRDAGVVLPADAGVPFDAIVTDEAGRPQTVGNLIRGRPTVLVFADYTCATLCGPTVAFVAAALEQSGLRPGKQFGLVVIGLDPKDGIADAEAMRRTHLGGNPAVEAATVFAIADQATVHRLTTSLGYRYVYDGEHDQFVHAAAAYVLRADGRVARVLTGLGLSGSDMRLALVEASEGRIGTLGDRVRLLCSGFDPTHGKYNVMVSWLLAGTGTATLLVLGGLLGMLMLLGRRRPT